MGHRLQIKNVFKEIGDKFINDEIVLKLKLEAKAVPAEEKNNIKF